MSNSLSLSLLHGTIFFRLSYSYISNYCTIRHFIDESLKEENENENKKQRESEFY